MKKIHLLTVFLLIIQLDSNGQSDWQWGISYGNILNDDCRSIVTDQYGNVYAFGTVRDSVDFNPDSSVANYLYAAGPSNCYSYLAKYSSMGSFKWVISLGQSYPGKRGEVVLDSAANVYVTGNFVGSHDYDPGPGVNVLTSALISTFICKYDSAANLKWCKALHSTDISEGKSIQVDKKNKNEVYVAGIFKGTCDFDPDTQAVFNLISPQVGSDFFICKLDSAGNFRWAANFRCNYYNSTEDFGVIKIDPGGSGNIYLSALYSGYIDYDPGPDSVIDVSSLRTFILKLDSASNFIWVRQFPVNNFNCGGFSINFSGQFLILNGRLYGTVDFDPGPGFYNMSQSNGSSFILKLDSSGNFTWAKQFGSSDMHFLKLIVDNSDNIYQTGTCIYYHDIDPGSDTFDLYCSGFFVSKLDESGNFQWAKEVEGGLNLMSVTKSMSFDPYGNLIIAGEFGNPFLNFGGLTGIALSNADTTFAPMVPPDAFIAKLDRFTLTPEIESPSKEADIFPNPATNQVIIRSSQDAIHSVVIFSLTGKKIFSEHSQSDRFSVEVPVEKWEPGIYFVKIQTEEGSVVRKLIVQ